MPELPEVETIRRQVEEHLVGAVVTKVEEKDHKALQGNSTLLVGKKIIGARRFAKLLVIDFSGGISLAVHLKMTGRLILVPAGKPLPEYTHVIFSLKGRSDILTYSDYRKFGYLQVVPTEEVGALTFVAKLGPEPLKNLTPEHFLSLCMTSKRPIKTLLMDQEKIAGIGNIYASEALWVARVNPRLKANALSPSLARKLFDAIEVVLKEGIARGGASDNSYRNLFGGKGEYQNFFKVYAREGKPCARCGTKIARITQAGRSTFFCSVCQK